MSEANVTYGRLVHGGTTKSQDQQSPAERIMNGNLSLARQWMSLQTTIDKGTSRLNEN